MHRRGYQPDGQLCLGTCRDQRWQRCHLCSSQFYCSASPTFVDTPPAFPRPGRRGRRSLFGRRSIDVSQILERFPFPAEVARPFRLGLLLPHVVDRHIEVGLMVCQIPSTFINFPGVVKTDKSVDFVVNGLNAPSNRFGNFLLGVTGKPHRASRNVSLCCFQTL